MKKVVGWMLFALGVVVLSVLLMSFLAALAFNPDFELVIIPMRVFIYFLVAGGAFFGWYRLALRKE